MPNVYEVHLSNGQAYEVTTNNHHDDHPAHVFQGHLLDILKGTVSGVLSAAITRVIFKGRR